jgi:hypothetical protein
MDAETAHSIRSAAASQRPKEQRGCMSAAHLLLQVLHRARVSPPRHAVVGWTRDGSEPLGLSDSLVKPRVRELGPQDRAKADHRHLQGSNESSNVVQYGFDKCMFAPRRSSCTCRRNEGRSFARQPCRFWSRFIWLRRGDNLYMMYGAHLAAGMERCFWEIGQTSISRVKRPRDATGQQKLAQQHRCLKHPHAPPPQLLPPVWGGAAAPPKSSS